MFFGSRPKALHSRLLEGSTLPNPSPWPPPLPRIMEPGSATGDCDHAFSNKKFEKDLLVTICTFIVILDVSANIYTLRVYKFGVPV